VIKWRKEAVYKRRRSVKLNEKRLFLTNGLLIKLIDKLECKIFFTKIIFNSIVVCVGVRVREKILKVFL
jgi:hypothetical protein